MKPWQLITGTAKYFKIMQYVATVVLTALPRALAVTRKRRQRVRNKRLVAGVGSALKPHTLQQCPLAFPSSYSVWSGIKKTAKQTWLSADSPRYQGTSAQMTVSKQRLTQRKPALLHPGIRPCHLLITCLISPHSRPVQGRPCLRPAAVLVTLCGKTNSHYRNRKKDWWSQQGMWSDVFYAAI